MEAPQTVLVQVQQGFRPKNPGVPLRLTDEGRYWLDLERSRQVKPGQALRQKIS